MGAKKEKPNQEEKRSSAVDKLTNVAASLAKLTAKATKGTQDSLRTVGAALMNMGGSKTRKIKAHSVIDPHDEGEIETATTEEMDEALLTCADRKGGLPLPAVEPTADQVGAMKTRVVVNQRDPYAGFSVLTPHGRRMAKLLRHRSWLKNNDGSWTPFEVPGPASFSAWEACWKVYAAILLMLPPVIEPITGEEVPFVTIQALENDYEYFKHIVK